jgi:hypothetical protein
MNEPVTAFSDVVEHQVYVRTDKAEPGNFQEQAKRVDFYAYNSER